ncbi:hypothetical protein EPO15_03720 [bacterium]|nr:MAG: hypothetical protein EPO15_03720 [bacterium]
MRASKGRNTDGSGAPGAPMDTDGEPPLAFFAGAGAAFLGVPFAAVTGAAAGAAFAGRAAPRPVFP